MTLLHTKLLDQARLVLRLKHMSYRTEIAYLGWIKRFILFHDKRHPKEMGAPKSAPFWRIWRSTAGWQRLPRMEP